ncbi:MAG TPA: 5-formyltetrahydrofolate cyclo-ligase, partial [Acidobacteria bacterium]|nr:5-formyltetrahydrofolate cyclo-ligase [Acidobacteriota bacterium]
MRCEQTPSTDGAGAAKTALRDRVLTTRRRRPLLERQEVARAMAEHLLASPEVRRAATVAAYVS